MCEEREFRQVAFLSWIKADEDLESPRVVESECICAPKQMVCFFVELSANAENIETQMETVPLLPD